MPLSFNLISNIDNRYGLQRDYEILKSLLENAGHYVRGVHFQRQGKPAEVDVNIYIETLISMHEYGKENWVFPNPEWFFRERDAKHLRIIDRILCKTKDSYDLFKEISPKASYFGFESRDLYRPEIKKQFRFLHVAGKSIVKNTVAIINAWKGYKIPYPLTIISTKPEYIMQARDAENISCFQYIPEDEKFVEVMNSHLFNLCPGEYEGWGHCIHEAMGTAAMVITTDAPPMNENGILEYCLVKSRIRGRMGLADLNSIASDDLARVVHHVTALSKEEIDAECEKNRQRFLESRDSFRANFLKLVNETQEKLNCGVA